MTFDIANSCDVLKSPPPDMVDERDECDREAAEIKARMSADLDRLIEIWGRPRARFHALSIVRESADPNEFGPPPMRELLFVIGSKYGLTHSQMREKFCRGKVKLARQEFMYQARLVGYAWTQIRKHLLLDDHTTVIYGAAEYAKREGLAILSRQASH